MTSLRPLLSFWSELVVSSLLARVNDAEIQTTWIVLDEFPSLGKVESLASGPERLRKYGGAVVLGMQQVSQIQEIYGHEVAQTIIGQCATKLILRCQDPETAKHMAEQLGRRQTRRVDETVSYGANSLRDGVGLTPREELELVALPDEVMNLPKFHGFIRVSNARESAPFPISTVRFEYRARLRRAEGLVPIGGPSPVDSFFSLLREGTAREPVHPGEDSGFRHAAPQAGAASTPSTDGESGSGGDEVAEEVSESSEGAAVAQASDRPARRQSVEDADRASSASALKGSTYVPGVTRDPAEPIARRMHEAANEQPRAFALLVERTRRESLENIPLSGLAVWRKSRHERDPGEASATPVQEQESASTLDGGPAFDPFSGR